MPHLSQHSVLHKKTVGSCEFSVDTKQGSRPVTAVRLRLSFNSALFLSLAASLWLVTNNATAQLTSCAAGSVCYYIAVQPIDVCATGATTSNPTGCAPFNTVNQTGRPGTPVSSSN